MTVTNSAQRRIRERREALGLSRRELAEICCCSVPRLQQLERGIEVRHSVVLERVHVILACREARRDPPRGQPTP